MEEKTILLAAGEKIIADRLCKILRDAHYKVDLAPNGKLGKELFNVHSYDLALVDFRLPDNDGCELCDYIRRRDDEIPLLMLSSGTDENKFEVFRAGVDSYCTITADPREILMRISVLTRRAALGFRKNHRIRAGRLIMDLNRKEVTMDAKPVLLSAREFLLLHYLLRNKNRIVSRSDIARSIWGGAYLKKEGRVAAFINSLRGKIDDPHGKKILFTVTGKGYMLTE